MSEEITEDKWCPKQSGLVFGYEPEYFDKDEDKWRPVPYCRVINGEGTNIPYPLSSGGVLGTIGLLGQAQANSIAWMFAANLQASGKSTEVRTAKYEIVYDIKAKRISENEPCT